MSKYDPTIIDESEEVGEEWSASKSIVFADIRVALKLKGIKPTMALLRDVYTKHMFGGYNSIEEAIQKSIAESA